MMITWRHAFAATILAFSLGASAHAAESDPRATARAISDAWARGQAKLFRVRTTQQIEALPWQERDQLAKALTGYVDIALAYGAQGLEGTIAATAAALASRDYDGWLMADKQLARLDEGYWIDKSIDHPNAAVPVARPGSAVVHYLPIGIARELVLSQVSTGTIDIEGALGASLCDPATVAEMVGRYGPRMAALLDALCQASGGGGVSGGVSLGFGSELSIIDCMMDHQETRAERIDGLMQACADSMLGALGGSPLADGSTSSTDATVIAPLGSDTGRFDPFVHGPTTVVDSVTYDAGHAEQEAKDRAESQVEYGDKGTEGTVVYQDEDGDMVWADGYEDGKRTESVELHDDNSYVVREYDDSGNVVSEQAYDSNGQATGGNAAKDAPGMDFGKTPECRALTVAMIGDRAAAVAVEAGGVDPRTVNPSPDGPVTEPGDYDCLQLSGGPTLDLGFGCNKKIAMCPVGQTLDAGCGCKSTGPQLTPKRQCGMFMLCADGVLPTQRDGSCTCGDSEAIFVDAGAGPRPLPMRLPQGM